MSKFKDMKFLQLFIIAEQLIMDIMSLHVKKIIVGIQQMTKKLINYNFKINPSLLV